MPAPDWYHPIDYADITALRRVSLAARAVFLEAFGAELGSKTGLVEIRPNLIAAESDGMLTRIGVETALSELAAAELVVWSQPERMAYHLGHLLRHGATNPKHAAGWRTQLMAMPACSARDAAVSELDGIPYRKGIDSLSVGYRLGNQQEQEQEQEQNRTPLPAVAAPTGATAGKVKATSPQLDLGDRTDAVSEPKPVRKRFVAPTEDEVCVAMSGNRREAIKFCAYYASKGWVVGKAPMKDWRQSVRGWMARNETDNNSRSNNSAGMMRFGGKMIPVPPPKVDEEPDVEW